METNSDYSDCDEGVVPLKTLKTENLLPGYHHVLKFSEFETDDTTAVNTEILFKGKVVGTITAYVMNRRSWHSNFYADCDSVSSELQLLSNVLFYKTGKIRKQEWGGVLTKDQIEKASFGIFLFISECKVSLNHRGKDLGFHALKDVITRTKSTISVVVPGYADCSIESLSHEIRNKKHQNVCKLFGRLGYKTVPRKDRQNYWYLLNSKVACKTKEEVENLKIAPLEPETKPATTSKELLMETEKQTPEDIAITIKYVHIKIRIFKTNDLSRNYLKSNEI